MKKSIHILVFLFSLGLSTSKAQCTASFTPIYGLNGLVTLSTTAILPQIGSFTLNYGDGSPDLIFYMNWYNPIHTYQNGTYTVMLSVMDYSVNATCTATYSQVVNVNSYTCNLKASFTSSAVTTSTVPNLVVFDESSTTGKNGNTRYFWDFGDGTTSGPVPIANNLTWHSYPTNGNYNVLLVVSDITDPTCVDSVSAAVSAAGCVVAAFTHTIIGNVAGFNSVSVNTNTGTTYYYWDFGDGTTSSLQNPTHIYQTGGAYLVKLKTKGPGFNCTDSIIQSVNISGVPCSANSNFSMVPTGTAQVWNVVPSYPWNVTAASWSWGDGSFSNTLFTSHQYSAAGMYSICLSVTVSCASTSSTCSTYSVYRVSEEAMILEINVVSPELISGLASVQANEELSWDLVPNPNAGEFKLSLNHAKTKTIRVVISDFTGRIVHDQPVDPDSTFTSVHSGDLPSGMYLVTLESGGVKTTKRMIVTH